MRPVPSRRGPAVNRSCVMTRRIHLVVAILIGTALLTVTLAAQRGREGAGPAGAPPANAPQGGRGAYQPTLWRGDEMFPRWPDPAGDPIYADLQGTKIKGYITEIP